MVTRQGLVRKDWPFFVGIVGGEGMGQEGGAKVVRRFSGKASDAPDRELIVQRSQRGAAGSGAQMRAVRRDGWTVERRKVFMETLAATCNVSEAARVAGKNLSSAYYQKRRDPGFAREWAQALGVGYAELEALLLRQALFGTEEEEVVLDGEGMVKSRKVKRGHPNAVGVRLLVQHRREAGERLAADAVERPDGEDAVERLREALERVRERRGEG